MALPSDNLIVMDASNKWAFGLGSDALTGVSLTALLRVICLRENGWWKGNQREIQDASEER